LFRRNKPDRSVFFVDASLGVDSEKNGTRLQDAELEKIISTWQSRKVIRRYSRVATGEEIASKKFNLNVPLYVKPSEENGNIDLAEAEDRVRRLEQQLVRARTRLSAALGELKQ
jgi:type I restriction enzyme M protein